MLWIQSDASMRPGQALFSYSNFNGAAIEVLNTTNVQVSIGNVLLPETSKNINDAKWHHVALTYSKASGRCKLLIDGQVTMDVQIPPLVPDIPISGLLVLGNRPGCDLLSKEERDQISADAFLAVNTSSLLFPLNGSQPVYRKPSTLLRQMVTDRQHALSAPPIRPSHLGAPWNANMAYGVDATQSFLQDSVAGGCFDWRLSFSGLLDDLRLVELFSSLNVASFCAFNNPYIRIYSFAKVADEINVEKNFYFVNIVNQVDVLDRFRSQSAQFVQGLELLHSFDPMSDLTSSFPLVIDESRKGRNSYCGGVKTSTLINPVYAKRAPTPTCSSAPISGGPFYCVTHGFGDSKKNNFDVFLPGNFGPGNFKGNLYYRVDTLPKVTTKNRLFNYAGGARAADPMPLRTTVVDGNKVGVTVSNNNPALSPSADFFVYRLYDINIFLDPTQIDDSTYAVLNYTVLLEPSRLAVPIDFKVNVRTDIPTIVHPLAFAPDLTSPNVLYVNNTEQNFMTVQHVMELPCDDIPDCSNWIIGSQFSNFEAASTSSAAGQRAARTNTIPFSSSVVNQATKRFCLTDEFSVSKPSLRPQIHCKALPVTMTDPLVVASLPIDRMFFSPVVWYRLERSSFTLPFSMGYTSFTPFTCKLTSGLAIANSACVCKIFDSSDPCNLCLCSSDPDPRQQTESQVVLQQCIVYAHLSPIPTPVCALSRCTLSANANPTIVLQPPMYLTRGSFLYQVLEQTSEDHLGYVNKLLDDPAVPRSIIGPESIMAAMLRATLFEEVMMTLVNKNAPFDDAVISYAARIDSLRGTRFFSLLTANKNATGYKKTVSKGSGDTCLVRGQTVQPGRRIFFDLPWRFAVTPFDPKYEFSGSVLLDWYNTNIVASSSSELIKRNQQIIVRARRLIEAVTLSQSSQSLSAFNDSPAALTLASMQITSGCKHWKISKLPSYGSLFSLDDFFGPDICSRSGLKGTQTIAAMFCRSFGFGVLPSSLTSSSQSFLNQLSWNVTGTTQPYPTQASLLMANKIRSTEQLISQVAGSVLNASFFGNESLEKFGTMPNLIPVANYWSKLWSGRLNYGRVLVDSSLTLGDYNNSFYSKCGLSGVEGLVLKFAEVVQPKSLVLKATVSPDVSMRILAKTMPRRQHSRHVLNDDQPTARVFHTRKTYVVDPVDNSTVSELRQQIRPKTLLTSGWAHVDSESSEGWVELWSGTGRDATTVPGQNLGELKFQFCLSDVTAWLETSILLIEICGSIGKSFGKNLDSSPLEGAFVAILDGTKGGTSSGRVVSPTANIIYM